MRVNLTLQTLQFGVFSSQARPYGSHSTVGSPADDTDERGVKALLCLGVDLPAGLDVIALFGAETPHTGKYGART